MPNKLKTLAHKLVSVEINVGRVGTIFIANLVEADTIF